MSDVELTISANVDAAMKEVAGFRKEYADLVKQVEKPLRQVNSFRELETTLEQTGRKIRDARDRVRDLGTAMASVEAPTKQMTADYRQAITELKRLERQEQTQIGKLGAMRRELQASGVDTRNLAAEQRRLSQEMSAGLQAGRTDAARAAAQRALGVGAIDREQAALLELRRQYQLLASDSVLSAKQRAEAESNYRAAASKSLAKLRELRAAAAGPASKADQAAELQREAQAAAAAARENEKLAARRALGVGAIDRTREKLGELRLQYQLVTRDESLSARQAAEAAAAYRRSRGEMLAKLRELRQATAQQASKAEQAAAAEARRYDLARVSLRQFSAEQARAAIVSRQAALAAAANELGVNRARAADQVIRQLNQQYELLRRSGNLTGRELAIAQETLTRKIRDTRRELAGIAADQKSAGGVGVGSAAGVAGAAYGSAGALRAYAEITDASKRMDSQLKLATSSQEEFNRAQEELFRIAQKTSSPIEEVTKVYARLAPALDEFGRKKDAVMVVDALTKALKLNGSTTAETASTLIQFSQAMGRGTLQGEEFNSLAEAAPTLMRELAKGLGVPTGALKEMGSEGKLTAEVITDLVVKALPSLTEQAAKLPDTVEGALTRLRNGVLKAFGKGDSSGLIKAIEQLQKLLTDPDTVEGLNNLAGGMATFVGWIIAGGREASKLAGELAYIAANANGYIDELTKLEKTLDGVKAARDGGTWIGRPTATLFMTKEQLDAWVKELEGQIQETQAKIAGLSVEAYRKQQEGAQKQIEAERQATTEQEKLDEQKFASFTKYVGNMKTAQGEAVKNAEEYLKKQVSAERKAASDLEAAQKAQLDTRKRYAEALAGMQGGGEASYASAQALKVKAAQALASGDVEGAKLNAQAALQMLQELAQAGENTFGFEGFIKSLQQIEESADQINVDKAKKALDEVKQKGVDLKALLDSVKTTTITVKMDDAALAKARESISDLAAMAGKPIDFGPAAARPDGGSGAPSSTANASVAISPAAAEQAVKQAGELASRMEEQLKVEPSVEPPKMFQDGNSFSQFPPVVVTPELDQAAVAAAQQQVAGLAQALQRQLVIPVQPVLTEPAPKYYQDGTSFSQFPEDGYATGGYTGPGGKWQPAGVVHAGEHVQPQEVVREPGALAFLERIRRHGFQATMQQLSRTMRGYATGGPVIPVARALPSIPSLSPELMAAAAGPQSLGTLNFNLPGGEQFAVQVTGDNWADLHKAALKYGRTRR